MIRLHAIQPNSIQMSKGDYFKYNIRLTQNDQPYMLCLGDEVVFTVRREASETSDILLQKRFEQVNTDVFPLEITMSDVADMPTGKYYYDVRIKKKDADGYITPCGPILFQLWEVVGC